MNESENFSERLQRWRARNDLKQPEAARLLGIGRTYYSELENGREPGKFLRQKFEFLQDQRVYKDDESESASPRLAEDPGPSGPRFILKQRREEMNLTPEDLAKISKVPAAYIRQIEEGEVQGSNEKQIRKLAAALKLDLEALMSGSDHPPILGEHHTTFGAKPHVTTTDNIKPKNIPLISMAQAGELVEFDDVYDYEGVLAYDGKDPRAFAVRIRGDSMSPQYSEGTIAICYPSHKPKNDNLVIAKLRDGSVLFKRLQIADGEVVFHSINPNYGPMRYPERDLVWIYPVGLTQKTEL